MSDGEQVTDLNFESKAEIGEVLAKLFTELENLTTADITRHEVAEFCPVRTVLKALTKNYIEYSNVNLALLNLTENFSDEEFENLINEVNMFKTNLETLLCSKSPDRKNPIAGMQTIIADYRKYSFLKKERDEISRVLTTEQDEQSYNQWKAELDAIEDQLEELEQKLQFSSIPKAPALRKQSIQDRAITTVEVNEDIQDEDLTEDEVQGILSLIDSHPKRFTEGFLREKGVPFSSNLLKHELAERLETAYEDRLVSASDLVELLDRIEGWGNQQIYLYTAHETAYQGSLSVWLEESSVQEHLREHKLEDCFNRNRPMFIPEKRTLSTIAWSEDRVRFVWVEKREHQKTISDEISLDDLRKAVGGFLSPRIYDLWDSSNEEVYFEAFTKIPTRGLTIFEWDIRHNQAMLLIQKLTSGTNYEEIRQEIHLELAPVLDISQFEIVQVSKAIRRIEREASSEERRRRRLIHRKDGAARGTFTSAGQGQDVYESFEKSLNALGDVISLQGDFIWLPIDDKPSIPVHTKIYRRDESISILKQHLEDDVRNVLSRIRSYCS